MARTFFRRCAPAWTVPALVGLGFALGLVGCKQCGGTNEGAGGGDAATLALPEVPAPDGLVADLQITSPDTTWSKLQRGVGGAVGILPTTTGGITCALAGLDTTLAAEIDGTSPMYGAVAASFDRTRPDERVDWAVALRLTDLRKARARLVAPEARGNTVAPEARGNTVAPEARGNTVAPEARGNTVAPEARGNAAPNGEPPAPFRGQERGGMTELVPVAAATGLVGAAPALALTQGGFLLVASRADVLTRLGPYVTQTLPARRGASANDVSVHVSRAAIAAVIAPGIEAAWASAKEQLLAADDRARDAHGGRAPDFADPKAIVAALDGWLSAKVATVSDLEGVDVGIDAVEDGVSVVATLTPAAGAGEATRWISEITPGDTAAIARLPSRAAFALSTRADNRAENAARAGGDVPTDAGAEPLAVELLAREALGKRLAEADVVRLREVLAAWRVAKGDVISAAFSWDEPRGLFVRAAVRDEAEAARAMRGALELAGAPPVAGMFGVRDVRWSTADVAGQKVDVATYTRLAPPPSKLLTALPGGSPAALPAARAPSPLAVAWSASGGSLQAGFGEAPTAVLRASSDPDAKLGDEPLVARALGALGADASTVLVAQPLRLDEGRANLPATPAVLAFGRRDQRAFVRMDVAYGLLREALHRQMAL